MRQLLLERPEDSIANVAQRCAWIWQEVEVPVANTLMSAKDRRKMQSYIKTANRMVRVTEEEQSVQDKPVLHAKAISNGIRDIGNPSLMRKVYLRNRSRTHHHYTHISNANFIALMRSHAPVARESR